VQPFEGFPADGIWLVTRGEKSQTLTVYLDDLDSTDLRMVTELSKKYDKLVWWMIEHKDRFINIADKAREIIQLLSQRKPNASNE
jgi:hypothetical protein